MGLASCYYELGQATSSLHYVKKSIDLDESNAEYHYLLGDVLKELGRLDECLSAYEKVHELEENHEDILIDLALTHEALDQADEAMNYYCQGIQEQSHNASLIYTFVAFLLRKGDLINASFYLDHALKNFYKEKEELFRLYPDAKYHPQVVELLEYYKK